MIKNIVFDMGKVLVGYDGMRVCEHFLQDPSDQQQVHTAVFVSPEWVQLDMGVIPEEQALAQMCSRLPERLRQPAAPLYGKLAQILYVAHRRSRRCGERVQGKGLWDLSLLQCISPSPGLLPTGDSGH